MSLHLICRYCIPLEKDEFFSHAQRSSIVDYILRRKSYTDGMENTFSFGKSVDICGIKFLENVCCMHVTAAVIAPIHHVPKKNSHLVFGHNFSKWTLIFTILSLLDSTWNFLQVFYRDFHLTLDMLLHYLAKSEKSVYSCFKTIPSSSHNFFSQMAVICDKILSKECL